MTSTQRTEPGPTPVGSMSGAAVRGVSWSLVSAVGQAVLQVLSMVVLSRLVAVQEFGIAVAATVVMSFALMLGQLGIGPALVQARRLEPADVATALYVSTALSGVLAGALIVFAPGLGRLVGLPPGSFYLHILAIALLLGGMSSVPAGLLQRRMRFRQLALVEVSSYGLGYLGTSVALAAAGAGAASLVWGQVAQSLMMAVGCFAIVRPAVRPSRLTVMATSARRLFRFGSGYSLAQLGNWFGNNGDNLVVTSTLGAGPLGIYSRAYQLLAQPANLIGNVADKVLFPSMSRIQDEQERLARAYVVVNSLVAVLAVPLSVLLFVLAPEVVDILLGSNWSAVTLPLQVFAVVLLPRTAYKISGSLTRATGAVFGGAWRQWLYAAEVVAGCWVGAHWGITGVAVGASGAIVLHFATMLVFSARIQRGLVLRVLRAYAKSLPSAVLTAVACEGVVHALRGSVPDIVTALATAAAAVATAAVVLLCTRRRFPDELAVFAAAHAQLRRRAG